MLLLDTNTFYYISNLSPSPIIDSKKFFSKINSTECIKISSVSFAEFISKYRNNAKIIRRVCSFMRERHISVNDQIIPFDKDIVKKLRTVKQKNLDTVWNTLILIKSNRESSLGAVIFLIVLFCETIFECNIDPYNVPAHIYDFFSLIFKDSIRPLITDIFKKVYFDAYQTDDAENFIRKEFYNCLKLFISLSTPLCKHVLKKCDEIPVGEKIDIPKIMQEYRVDWQKEMDTYQNKIDKEDTPAKFVHKRGIKYGKSINDKHLRELLNGLSNSLKKVFTNSAIEEYIYSIINNTLSSGGAFYKNDINDALILATLKPSDKILTFDNGMIQHMRNHSELRQEYRNSISLIESF